MPKKRRRPSSRRTPASASPARIRKIKRYGWIPDIPDQRDFLYAASPAFLRALPPRLDLRKQCPPAYDQGQLGSCTANAVGGAIEFDQMKEKLPQIFIPSRLFIYYNERVIEGTVNTDAGAMPPRRDQDRGQTRCLSRANVALSYCQVQNQTVRCLLQGSGEAHRRELSTIGSIPLANARLSGFGLSFRLWLHRLRKLRNRHGCSHRP